MSSVFGRARNKQRSSTSSMSPRPAQRMHRPLAQEQQRMPDLQVRHKICYVRKP